MFLYLLLIDDISTLNSLDQGYSDYMIVRTSSTTPTLRFLISCGVIRSEYEKNLREFL